MSEPDVLSVAREYSRTPGPRSESDGPFSGERFLAELLGPRFRAAQLEGRKLVADLDGTEGYATSFLEAAFGGLAGEFSSAAVLKRLEIKSEDEPYLKEKIVEYVKSRKAA